MTVTPDSLLSRSAVMRAGVWPTIIALIVAAVLIIERLQVDWTVSCELVSATPGACPQNFYESLFSLLLPSFAFALAHIVGAVGLYPGGGTRQALLERAGKFAVFFAINVFPAFGWILFYAGLAAGVLISITVIGLVVAPVVGAMGAGFASGLLLAFAAGPSIRSLNGAGWKRLICYYGGSTAIAPLALFGPPLLALSLFGPEQRGVQPVALTSVIVTGLTAVALSSSIVWIAALKAAHPTRAILRQPAVRTGLAIVAAVMAVLVLPVHLMISNGVKLLPADGGLLTPISSFVRGYKPPIATTLELAGLRYIGPRTVIHERGMLSRPYAYHEKQFEGTAREVTFGETRYKSLQEWRVRDPASALNEMVHIVADGGGESATFSCQRAKTNHEHCTVSPDLPLAPDTMEKTKQVAYKEGDRYEFIDGLEFASLFIRWDLRKGKVAKEGEPYPRLYCRLNLVAVTKAAFSVHQIIPCDAEWPAEARRVREYVESLFVQSN